MKRLTAALVALGILTSVAVAQVGTTGTSDNTTSLADNPPAMNVRTIQSRAPGRIIDAARARHIERSRARLAAQRNRDTSVLLPAADNQGAAGFNSGGLFGGLANSLLQTLFGGALGGTGSLGGTGTTGGLSFGNLLGPGSAGGTSTGGTTGTGLGNLPPEVLQMLQSFGIDPKDLANLKTNQPPADKQESRFQSTDDTTQQRKFIVRWADAMAQTFFAAITVGMQSQDFVNMLKDALRPLFQTNTDTASDTSTTDTSGSDGSGDTTSGDTTGGDSGDSSSDNPII